MTNYTMLLPTIVWIVWNEEVNLFRDLLNISKDFEIKDVIFGL